MTILSGPAWLIFLLSGLIIVLAGIRLAHDGDILSVRTGLGGTWVGAIFLAVATSLPEMTTDLSAVRQGTPSLAVGDLFGSSMANLLILATIDLATIRVRMLTRVTENQVLVGTLGIGLTAAAAAGMLAGKNLTIFGIGWAPFVIVLGYIGGMRLLYLNRFKLPFETVSKKEQKEARKESSLRNTLIGFALAALAIYMAAPALAASTSELSQQIGITTGFAGITLLAITTSLPELVVSIASVRAGSYDLAVGNLLGSNAFNMMILIVLDVADGPGSLLAEVGPGVVVAAAFTILLMSQVILDVLNRVERRIWYLEPGPLALVATYFFGLYLSFMAGH